MSFFVCSPLSHPSQRKGVTRWMWLALAQTFSNNTCLRLCVCACGPSVHSDTHPPIRSSAVLRQRLATLSKISIRHRQNIQIFITCISYRRNFPPKISKNVEKKLRYHRGTNELEKWLSLGSMRPFLPHPLSKTKFIPLQNTFDWKILIANANTLASS